MQVLFRGDSCRSSDGIRPGNKRDGGEDSAALNLRVSVQGGAKDATGEFHISTVILRRTSEILAVEVFGRANLSEVGVFKWFAIDCFQRDIRKDLLCSKRFAAFEEWRCKCRK